MTTTQTEIVATNCVILLDNASAVPTDISGSANSVSYSPSNGVAEWNTFGTQWKQRRVVHKDMPVTLNIIYSTAANEGAQLVEDWFFDGNDNPRTLYIYLPDQEVGAFVLSGEYVLMDYNVAPDAEADDVVRLEANLAPDNVVTRSTNAT